MQGNFLKGSFFVFKPLGPPLYYQVLLPSCQPRSPHLEPIQQIVFRKRYFSIAGPEGERSTTPIEISKAHVKMLWLIRGHRLTRMACENNLLYGEGADFITKQPPENLEEFASFCSKHKLHFISDEIYAKSVFDNPAMTNPTPFVSTLALDMHKITDPTH
ncbi:hypothetical protein B0J15DRAFT_457011 [Fusarium solani]|uniref:Aminotransferase class I/classII large domain-containing protein n=1 Tax=Fusarium solani TaxID=169388 RepID=A0A9P9L6B5_FUSSL|nr:uncharacterized protein B0J15DRAFT_457011 [Fusarium solani]KAH7274796.1 hypothetical protein B0J15DRAFT_457011 [Fusarium solani]